MAWHHRWILQVLWTWLLASYKTDLLWRNMFLQREETLSSFSMCLVIRLLTSLTLSKSSVFAECNTSVSSWFCCPVASSRSWCSSSWSKNPSLRYICSVQRLFQNYHRPRPRFWLAFLRTRLPLLRRHDTCEMLLLTFDNIMSLSLLRYLFSGVHFTNWKLGLIDELNTLLCRLGNQWIR